MFIKSFDYYTENKVTLRMPDGRSVSFFLTPGNFKGNRQTVLTIDAEKDIKFEFETNIRDFRNQESNYVTEKNYNM